MAGPSNYFSILTAIKSKIDGLQLLDWNSAMVPSAVRKLPKVDEVIDRLPLLCIVPKDSPPGRKTLTFGPFYKMSYPVEVVFVAPGHRDFTAHLDFYTGWIAAINTVFDLPAGLKASVPQVWDVKVKPELTVDRGEVNNDYDYGGLTVEVITSEQ